MIDKNYKDMDKEKSEKRKFDENVKKCFKWVMRRNFDDYRVVTNLNHLKWLLEKAWNEMFDDGELMTEEEIEQFNRFESQNSPSEEEFEDLKWE